jgi:preprotein translocase subunit SecG
MIQILLIVHIFIGILLVGVILIQKSEGGGLGSSQQASLFTARGSTNFFTRATATLSIIFAVNCLVMGILLGKKTESLFKGQTIPVGVPAPPPKDEIPSSVNVNSPATPTPNPVPATAENNK